MIVSFKKYKHLVKQTLFLFGVIFFLSIVVDQTKAQGSLGKIRNRVSGQSNAPAASQPDDERQEKERKPRKNESNDRLLDSVRVAVSSSPANQSSSQKRDRRTSPRRNDRHRSNLHRHRHRGGRNNQHGFGYFCAQSPAFVPTTTIVQQDVIVLGNDLPPSHMIEGTAVPQYPSGFDDSIESNEVFQSVVEDELDSDMFSQWALRTSAFYGTDFDSLTHGSFGLLVQAPGAVGIDASVTTWRESGFAFRDNLWLGDVNLVFENITSPDVRTRIGIGVNWMADAFGGNAGLNLTAGTDIRLTERVLLTGEVDLGTLGDADFFHGQLSAGYQMRQTEWMIGYNHYNIGGTNIKGFFTGFRWRF